MQPSASRRSQRCEPMKPAEPVTSTARLVAPESYTEPYEYQRRTHPASGRPRVVTEAAGASPAAVLATERQRPVEGDRPGALVSGLDRLALVAVHDPVPLAQE